MILMVFLLGAVIGLIVVIYATSLLVQNLQKPFRTVNTELQMMSIYTNRNGCHSSRSLSIVDGYWLLWVVTSERL